MQVVGGFIVLAITAGAIWVRHVGIAQTERSVARWLLADARARDARDREFAAARVALLEVGNG